MAAQGTPSRPGLRAQPTPPVPAEERARTYVPKPIPADAVRVTGDDLLTDLFEAMSDLHFLAGAFEGADFVLDLALQKLPCAVGVLSLFDMNRREFVVVRQVGGDKSGLLYRLPEGNRVAQTAMRSGRAQLVPAAEAGLDGKWARIGVAPTSLACAPIEHGGRYLGLIELCNPIDGRPFSDSDGHALTYIGRQYGEFLAERSVVLEPETVMQGLA
ncbi:MAG: GAF domain-containing protein [Myxococcales bacterium]|nr:GAF domain-containing protein [Myxococcales bacterium]